MRRYFILAAILFSTSGYLFAQGSITSFFDSNAEGWIAVNNNTSIPTYFATGGNPGGYISITDNRAGIAWYWQAPAKFLGDVSCAYSGSLSFDLKQSLTINQTNGIDIVLVGGGLTLVFNTLNNPGTAWTSYSVSLIETAGWTKTTLTGPPPTQAEMLSVLSSLTKLQIRGEYSSSTSGDRTDLDNVVLTMVKPTATVSGDATICVGSSATISAVLTGAAPWSITWSDGLMENDINSSPATRVVSPASTTTFTITNITNANGCSNNGSGSAKMTVNPLPNVIFNPVGPFCINATAVDLSSAVSPAGGTFSGPGVSGNMFDPAAAGTGTHLITYSFTDGNGCPNSASRNVTVNSLPTVTFNTVGPFYVSSPAVDLSGSVLPAGGAFSGPGVSGNNFDPSVAGVGTHTITYTFTSGNNCSNSKSQNVTVRACNPPVIVTIIVPVDPTLINTVINASADFTAECDNDDHSATWDWGDNTPPSPGAVDQTANKVTGSHSYIAAGVYTVTLIVTDGAGNSGEGTATAFVVIYDPNAGFVTGGGWIMSPAGAYVADLSLTGKANFGFVSKYKKGKTIPDGNTEFNFKTGNLNFHSTVYEWLVIAGPNAKYKGSGTINNSGNYGFMLTARDGQVNGGGGVDRFRIKIWDKNNGDALVYDNQKNDPDDADATDAIEGGSITIHSSGASKEAADASEPVPVSFMLEQNYPNPFNPGTTIKFDLPEASKATLKIYSEIGQLVATLVDGEMNVGRYAISWEGRNQSGAAVASGVYFYQLVVQGSNGDVIFAKTKRMTLVK
ncbi:MAG: laminin B domain-containing protein [bacterium]